MKADGLPAHVRRLRADIPAEDLPPDTPVAVYARLTDPDAEAIHLADVIQWCHRRRLAFRGAYGDTAGGELWEDLMSRARQGHVPAIVIPGLDHLGADPGDQQARLDAAAAAGASVAIAPRWERLIPGQRFNGEVFGGIVQAGTLHGGINVNLTVPELPPPPRMLPTPPTPVTRPDVKQLVAELTSLQPHTADGPLLAVITGPQSAGKTVAALNWLSGLDWPDGHLYADLHAGPAMTDDQLVSPSSVLAAWLPALGVSRERVPCGLAEQAAFYRSLTAGKRLGILLDGAISAAQVRALIPNGPSVVLVTSRMQLTGLIIDGASFLQLG